jgi:predicted nucleic acid-binding protein
MRIVVDSNIVFSAILNSQSRIGQIIINSSNFFQFYSVMLLKEEIKLHKDKIRSITGFTNQQFQISFQKITSRISFIDDILIPDEVISEAVNLVAGIDEKDSMFVALANFMNAKLWTGDKKLTSGLKNKGYSRTISTNDIYDLFLENKMRTIVRKK